MPLCFLFLTKSNAAISRVCSGGVIAIKWSAATWQFRHRGAPRTNLYDKVIEFGGKIPVGHIPPIFPVDEMRLPRFSNNRIYLESNIAISNAKYCICIGMSPFGLEHSLLALEKAKKVFYTGKETFLPNFVPLNMRAKPLINELLS